MKQIDKTKGIKTLPECERPREKLLLQGPGMLTNAELLALVIGSGTRNLSALELAAQLLSIGGNGPSDLVGCLPQELMRLPGIGEARACSVSAAVELGRRIAAAPACTHPLLDSPSAAAGLYMEELRRLPKEIFRVLMLNVKSELIAKEDISVGGLNYSLSHPREVFSGAVRKGAYAVILMHNHPSGDPTPSREDISTTKILCDAGDILGIKVVDHILIGDGRYMSFREKNML